MCISTSSAVRLCVVHEIRPPFSKQLGFARGWTPDSRKGTKISTIYYYAKRAIEVEADTGEQFLISVTSDSSLPPL